MANTLPLILEAGALPPSVRWTPQQLIDAAFAGARIVTQQSFALFVTGSTEPSSNVGPWLKNGVEWYVYSSNSGNYVPITIAQESLGYFIGELAPSPLTFRFWIRTTAGGSPLGISIYYSGSWVDVYAAQLATYATITAMNAAIAAGDAATLASANAYTDAQIGMIPGATPPWPAQGESAGAQAITTNGVPVKVVMDVANINPAPAPINTGTGRYVAPGAGIYMIAVLSQFDNVSAVAADVETNLVAYINGNPAIGDFDDTPSPNGGRWSPGFTYMATLNAADYVELFADVADGVGTNVVNLTSFRMSIWRVSA